MKQYTVYFNEPVCHKYLGVKFNQELKEWEHDVECEEVNDTFTFDSLATAKKMGINTVGVYDVHSGGKQDEVKKFSDVYIKEWREYKININ